MTAALAARRLPTPDPAGGARSGSLRLVSSRPGSGRPAPSQATGQRRVAARRQAAIYRRRRLAALGVAVLAAATLWLVAHALLTAASGRPGPSLRPAAAHTWVVRPGDTAWRIALASGATGDIRPVVDAIEAQVGGRPLQVGERVTVPVG